MHGKQWPLFHATPRGVEFICIKSFNPIRGRGRVDSSIPWVSPMAIHIEARWACSIYRITASSSCSICFKHVMPPASFQALNIFSNPAGLYVYRKWNNGGNVRPRRGRIFHCSYVFYKHLMPLASKPSVWNQKVSHFIPRCQFGVKKSIGWAPAVSLE